MDSVRQQKVGQLILEEISQLFPVYFSHLTTGVLATFTVCRVSSDLSSAKIFISFFPTSQSDKMIANCNKEKKEIRHKLSEKLRHHLRKIPELKFYLDDSAEKAQKIDQLLK